MYDSEAEFERAVFNLKLAVQRDSYVAFQNGLFRDNYNRVSWPHGQLWWFDWETNLRELWAGEPVCDARPGWVQMSTEIESNVAEKGSDDEELDDEDLDADEDLDDDEAKNTTAKKKTTVTKKSTATTSASPRMSISTDAPGRMPPKHPMTTSTRPP